LPNIAKLELCPRNIENQLSTSNVKIAFQLPDNQRLTGEFSTATLLSQIIDHFSEQLHRLVYMIIHASLLNFVNIYKPQNA